MRRARGAWTVVVVPLLAGVRERVLELLAKEPPFEPETGGLERYEVFVTDDEAVLALEAMPETLERIVEEAVAWLAAGNWQVLIAGPARSAPEAYSWVRPHLPDNVVFQPTPGPGDSEGGDVFSPAF